MDCGAKSIFMTARLRKPLGLVDKPSCVTTLGLNGQVIGHPRESRKMAFRVQFMEHLAPVQESEGLVVPIRACHLVL